MIHLDANYLILANRPGSEEDVHLQSWLRDGEILATSAIAWMEFVSGPVSAAASGFIRLALDHRIVPVGATEAEHATRLFNLTGRKRSMRYDCLIAATAIVAGAELATRNLDDFRLFVPHGLQLAPNASPGSA